jgi:hypothetical protein
MTPRMSIEERNAKCAEMDHPGVTYSPWVNLTFCVCGLVSVTGDSHSHGIACCGGPLDRWKDGAA